ncbi:MAG: hypothetical protein R3A47_06930 [Polyangiales bacterium]
MNVRSVRTDVPSTQAGFFTPFACFLSVSTIATAPSLDGHVSE